MNEKFSELAANIPELVEAIAAGKRPTKGEIVKASIARHQEQERRVRELMHEIQMLRSSNAPADSQSMPLLDTSAPIAPAAVEPMMQVAQSLAMPYQIQASHPIGAPASHAGNLWVGQLLNKTQHHEPLSLCLDSHPLPLLPDMASQPVSPFKQTSMMNWGGLSSLPQPLDPASLSIGFPNSAGTIKGFFESGTLEQLAHRDSGAVGGPTPTSGFSSPTFTSSDSDSTFSTDALDSSSDERRFLAESMSFEPFAMPNTMMIEQTPLSSLVGLPAAEQPAGNKKPRRSTTTATTRRSRKDEATEEFLTQSSPFGTTVNVAN